MEMRFGLNTNFNVDEGYGAIASQSALNRACWMIEDLQARFAQVSDAIEVIQISFRLGDEGIGEFIKVTWIVNLGAKPHKEKFSEFFAVDPFSETQYRTGVAKAAAEIRGVFVNRMAERRGHMRLDAQIIRNLQKFED